MACMYVTNGSEIHETFLYPMVTENLHVFPARHSVGPIFKSAYKWVQRSHMLSMKRSPLRTRIQA